MQDHRLGKVRSRYAVAVRSGPERGMLVSNTPFISLEVHDGGVVVRRAAGHPARLRRGLNVALMPITRPIPFLLGERAAGPALDEWVMPWEGIARVTHPTKMCLTFETQHGGTKTLRFRRTRALRAALDTCRLHIRDSSTNGNHA